jgi:hypothetical protein
MNVLVKTVGGGIFSTFTIAIQQILEDIPNVNDINNIYIELDKDRYTYSENILNSVTETSTRNPFDYVLDQINLNPDITLNANFIKTYLNHNDLYGTEELKNLQIICSKIKIKKNILDKIKSNINEKTLGVHVRLTDMLDHHLELHNGGSTQDYIDSIKSIIIENEIENIFVSSDNEFSLHILKENFDILHNEVNNINKTEFGGDYFKYQLDNIHLEYFWVDSFVDMMSLSRCGVLLYKLSNLNNTSLFFSETLKKFYKI